MKKGFTLIELLAVIVILAVILVIAVPKIINVIKSTKQSTLDSDAVLISKQLQLYKESQGLDVTTLTLIDIDTYGFNSSKYNGFKAEVINDKVAVTLIKDELTGSNYAGTEIYGVKFENSSTGTRTDNAVGLTYSDPTTSAEIDSDFDTKEIYNEIVEVTEDGNVFVKIPKFYIKKQKLGPQIWTYQISKSKVDSDYYLPACFVDEVNNKILSYVLVGKYEASTNGTKLESNTGKTTLASTTIATAKTYLQNNGTGYQFLDIHMWDVIQTLFYIEFATLNSQSIMAGYTSSDNATALNTGQADIITTTGSPISNITGTYPMKYRGVENLWGNVWDFVDGINIKNYVAYVSKDATTYSTTSFSGAYKKVGYTNNGVTGTVSEMGYDQNYPYVNLPISLTGTKIYGDYSWQDQSDRVVFAGSYWYVDAYAGISSWNLYRNSSISASHFGFRIAKTPLN